MFVVYHQTHDYYMFRPNCTTLILLSMFWYSVKPDDVPFRSKHVVTKFIKCISIFLVVIDGEFSVLLFRMTTVWIKLQTTYKVATSLHTQLQNITNLNHRNNIRISTHIKRTYEKKIWPQNNNDISSVIKGERRNYLT